MHLVEGIITIGDTAAAEGEYDACTAMDNTGKWFATVDMFVDQLEAIGTEYDVTVQAFDARYIVSRKHLRRAVEMAERAREHDESIARDHAVEILLYAAGRRQINQAMEIGVSDGMTPIAVVITGGDQDERVRQAASAVAKRLHSTKSLGRYDEDRIRQFFDITDAELNATDATLEDLVVERIALLAIEK